MKLFYLITDHALTVTLAIVCVSLIYLMAYQPPYCKDSFVKRLTLNQDHRV